MIGLTHRPLAIDLFAGLGGWTEGLLAEGYDVIGFDIERHVYGEMRYPAQLVIQDVLTLHGTQFRNAALIVASPPCQAYSYRAMPWSRAKALPPPDNTLFESCFRIQREACDSAGRHIPLVVENVRGAQKWVGRARWNYGSFYLWGDVPALMPVTLGRQVMKAGITHRADGSTNFHGGKLAGRSLGRGAKPWGPNHISPGSDEYAELTGQKVPGFRFDGSGKSFQSASVENTGVKIGGDWFSDPESTCRKHGSKSPGRKMASAMIAKIPLPLSRHIARTYLP